MMLVKGMFHTPLVYFLWFMLFLPDLHASFTVEFDTSQLGEGAAISQVVGPVQKLQSWIYLSQWLTAMVHNYDVRNVEFLGSSSWNSGVMKALVGREINTFKLAMFPKCQSYFYSTN